jgi:hypothetical protein
LGGDRDLGAADVLWQGVRNPWQVRGLDQIGIDPSNPTGGPDAHAHQRLNELSAIATQADNGYALACQRRLIPALDQSLTAKLFVVGSVPLLRHRRTNLDPAAQHLQVIDLAVGAGGAVEHHRVMAVQIVAEDDHGVGRRCWEVLADIPGVGGGFSLIDSAETGLAAVRMSVDIQDTQPPLPGQRIRNHLELLGGHHATNALTLKVLGLGQEEISHDEHGAVSGAGCAEQRESELLDLEILEQVALQRLKLGLGEADADLLAQSGSFVVEGTSHV